jgi:hypothetical protein
MPPPCTPAPLPDERLALYLAGYLPDNAGTAGGTQNDCLLAVAARSGLYAAGPGALNPAAAPLSAPSGLLRTPLRKPALVPLHGSTAAGHWAAVPGPGVAGRPPSTGLRGGSMETGDV